MPEKMAWRNGWFGNLIKSYKECEIYLLFAYVNRKCMLGLIILMIIPGFCSFVYADDVGRGGVAGSFIRMGLGARANGMGGTGVAVYEDACAVYYNPASLVFLNQKTITASLNQMALDRSLSYFGYAMPLGNRDEPLKPGQLNAGFGVGWVRASVDNIDSRDFSGQHLEMLDHSNNAFYFSFAINPGPKLALGLSGKVLFSRFPKIADQEEAMHATGFGFDLGMLLKPHPSLSVGVTLRDLRSKYTWDSQKMYDRGTQTVDKLPSVIRGGIAWQLFEKKMMISADVEKVKYFPAFRMFGLQWRPFKQLHLRCGLREKQVTAGFGLGVKCRGYHGLLDYAYVPDPVAPGDNHVMTWSFLF